MEPTHEFGKEAMENINAKNARRQRRARTITLVTVLFAAAIAFLYWQKQNKTRVSAESAISKDEEQQAPPSSEVKVTKTWKLPDELKEISGFSYYDEDRFACIQDEDGKVFIYNTKTSKIDKEIPFASAGDYEGLTVADKDVWVVRSDGKLYQVSGVDGTPTVKEFQTSLTAQQNVEGVCYDKPNHRLLLSIKDEEASGHYKGIYAFNLETGKMDDAPVFKINLQDELFRDTKAKKEKKIMMPSDIAIHPLTKELYITDGPKAKLLVMNANGELKKLYQLDTDQFPQPEGIAFDPKGELFISNEGGKNINGTLLSVEINE
jgi:uncharacterized protein YjiK